MPGQLVGCSEDLRACTYCRRVVLSFLQQSDAAGGVGTRRPPPPCPRLEFSSLDLLLFCFFFRSFAAAQGGEKGSSGEDVGGVVGGAVGSAASPASASAAATASAASAAPASRPQALKRRVSVSFQEERFAPSRGRRPPAAAEAGAAGAPPALDRAVLEVGQL